MSEGHGFGYIQSINDIYWKKDVQTLKSLIELITIQICLC